MPAIKNVLILAVHTCDRIRKEFEANSQKPIFLLLLNWVPAGPGACRVGEPVLLGDLGLVDELGDDLPRLVNIKERVSHQAENVMK